MLSENVVKAILVIGVSFFALLNSWVENRKKLFLVQYLVLLSIFGVYLFMRNYFNGCESCSIDFDGIGLFYYVLELLFYSAITFSILSLFFDKNEKEQISSVIVHREPNIQTQPEILLEDYKKSIPLNQEIESIKKVYSNKIKEEQAKLICKYACEHSISTSTKENEPLEELLISSQMKISLIEKYFSSFKDDKQQVEKFEVYLISCLADNTQIESLESVERLMTPLELTKSEELISKVPIPEKALIHLLCLLYSLHLLLYCLLIPKFLLTIFPCLLYQLGVAPFLYHRQPLVPHPALPITIYQVKSHTC